MMNDIETREDLEFLLREFYTSLLRDDEMRRIFIDVMNVDLDDHIHIIADFWQQVVFGTGSYRRNAMQIHVEINEHTHLTPAHFKTWLQTFEATVNRHFSGTNAARMITRALSIATIMQAKLSQNGD